MLTLGVILMVIGIVGFDVSLFFWSTWGDFGGPARAEATVIRERRPRY